MRRTTGLLVWLALIAGAATGLTQEDLNATLAHERVGGAARGQTSSEIVAATANLSERVPVALEPPSGLGLDGEARALTVADFDRDGTADLAVAFRTSDGSAVAVYRGDGASLYPHTEEARYRTWVGERPGPFRVGELIARAGPGGGSRSGKGGFESAHSRVWRGSLAEVPAVNLVEFPIGGEGATPGRIDWTPTLERFGLAPDTPWTEMRLNADAIPDLVVIPEGPAPIVLMSMPSMIFTVNTIADTDDGSCDPLGTGSGNQDCTLREAIGAANGAAGADAIHFAIPGSGPHTIQPLSPLPQITEAVTVDGYTQSDAGCTATQNTDPNGFNGTLCVVLDGSAMPAPGGDEDALSMANGSTTVRGLVINGFQDDALEIGITGSNVIEGNFVGLDDSGTLAVPNTRDGLQVFSGDNLIGGTLPAARNVFSASAVSRGMIIFTFNGNPPSENNFVQGNFMGTDKTGLVALGNATSGITISNSPNNTVGGLVAGARNVISGNLNQISQGGVTIFDDNGTSAGNVVQGNYIGVDVNCTSALPNAKDGVNIFNGSGSTVGGTAAGAGNVISGNGRDGVRVETDAARGDLNVVQGNLIGTGCAGTAALPNSEMGVSLFSDANTVGGPAAAARNVISGNLFHGVRIENGNDNAVEGNYIGTDASGSSSLGNGLIGVYVLGSSSGNRIGGAGAGAGNVVSGNGDIGVLLGGPSDTSTVRGNLIGRNAADSADLPGHSMQGVWIPNSSGNVIGGGGAGEGNVIAGSGHVGILINENSDDNEVEGNVIARAGSHGVQIFGTQADRNRISSNSISQNAGLGIDLGEDGSVTANDPDDVDAGANALQNYPRLDTAVPGSTLIEGALDSTPTTTFDLEFFASQSCDGSDHGEGELFLGTQQVTTDAGGDATINVTLAGQPEEGSWITATATDPNGNSSEFSRCRGFCEPVRNVPDQTVSGEARFAGCTTLVAAGVEVSSTGDLTLLAGESIEIADGFVVADGGVLILKIDPALDP